MRAIKHDHRLHCGIGLQTAPFRLWLQQLKVGHADGGTEAWPDANRAIDMNEHRLHLLSDGGGGGHRTAQRQDSVAIPIPGMQYSTPGVNFTYEQVAKRCTRSR